MKSPLQWSWWRLVLTMVLGGMVLGFGTIYLDIVIARLFR